MMDKLRIFLTIRAALKFYDLLVEAIEARDDREIGRELHNLGRELKTLERLLSGET